jgi:hypothetical protein
LRVQKLVRGLGGPHRGSVVAREELRLERADPVQASPPRETAIRRQVGFERRVDERRSAEYAELGGKPSEHSNDAQYAAERVCDELELSLLDETQGSFRLLLHLGQPIAPDETDGD